MRDAAARIAWLSLFGFACWSGCRETEKAPPPAAAPSQPASAAAHPAPAPEVELVDLGQLPPNHLYRNNRPPLGANPFAELPLGAIAPRGWLLTQLRLLATGLTRHLPEFDEDFSSKSAWLGGEGESWERGPYYFRGLTALAHVLQDEELTAMARKWIDWALTHQDAGGWIGPSSRQKELDWWPNMVVLDALRDHYSATGDNRVVEAMRRYFAFQRAHLEEVPLKGWAKARGGDNLDSVYWLYNLTGDADLLVLADILASQTRDYTADYLSERAPDQSDHVVNHAMGFKQPAVRFQATQDLSHLEALERGWKKTMDHHGRLDGMFSGDEPLHGLGSTRGTEMCAIVEMIYSLTAIQRIAGSPHWSDRLEKVAYNALPGGFTRDLRGFLYYIQQNQVQCTLENHGFYTDHKNDLTYGPQTGYNCCRSNLHMGWPKFAASLWLAAPGDGLAAMAYAPCELAALVGEDEGVAARIEVATGYPFEELVLVRLRLPRPARFPLALRIPGWCERASARLNGGTAIAGAPASFLTLLREWRDGDQVALSLPMPLRSSAWINDSIGLELGPLVLALKIESNWKRFGGPEGFPASEVLPASPWNYALELDPAAPGSFFKIERRPVPEQPFDPEQAPVRLLGRGRRVPAWAILDNSAAEVPRSPVPEDQLEKKSEPVTLIPYGAAKLRVALFPWAPPKK